MDSNMVVPPKKPKKSILGSKSALSTFAPTLGDRKGHVPIDLSISSSNVASGSTTAESSEPHNPPPLPQVKVDSNQLATSR
jgi:hypothetical protein